MTNNPDDTCKCGIRRSDCDYHKPEAAGDALIFASKGEQLLPESLKTSLADLLREQGATMISWLAKARKDGKI